MGRIMIDDYFRDWLTLRSATVRPRTLEQYEGAARTIVDALKGRSLDELTPVSCAAVYAPIMAVGHGRTAQIVYTVMTMALKDAVMMGLIAASPMNGLHRPKHVPAEIEPYSAEDARKLLECSHHRIAWQLLHGTGIRRGEACALQWRDIDIKGRSVRVARQLVSIHGETVETVPKSATSVRLIPISSDLAEALRSHLCSQVMRGRKGDYVVSEDGSRIAPYTLGRWQREAADLCGVADARLHRWRHTYGADAVSAGVDIRILQRLLGHCDISVTAKYYAYVRGNALRDAVEKMTASGYI